MRAVGLVMVSLALMVLDHREHLGDPIRTAITALARPFHLAVDLPFELIGAAAEQLKSRRQLIEENARLRAQQLIFEARLQRLDSMERENIALRELLQSSYEVTESVLIAELLRVDLDPYSHLIQINRGRNNDVFAGQPVLDAKGIMGQVDTAGPFSATVRLLTDPGHAIPVQVSRNGLRSIALGVGDIQRLELANLPNNADIQVGDLLISSGLGGRFPQGYPVGRVTHVEIDPGQPFARVSAEPMAALDRSREVLLVRTSQRQAAVAAAGREVKDSDE